MCAKTLLIGLAVVCGGNIQVDSALAQRSAKAQAQTSVKAPTKTMPSAPAAAIATPRDKYFLAAAEVYDELAAEHARLAELYRALPDRDTAVKAHAASVRTEVQFAQRNYRLISDEARRDAEISQRLKEIAQREAALLEKANKLAPPVTMPTARSTRATRANTIIVERNPGGTRIPQSFYTSGEGHFID